MMRGDLVAGADRHRRLGDDHRVAVADRGGDLARRLVDVGEVGEAIGGARRRADGDEDGRRALDGVRQVLW